MALLTPLSRRTQAEIEALCGFTMKGWNPLDTLTYKGTFNGWPVTYSRTYTGAVDANGVPDLVTRDELEGATSFLAANGIEPAGVPAAMPVQHSAGAPQAYAGGMAAPPPQAPPQQYPQGGGWACPIHGASKVKQGTYGAECAVHTTTMPAYRHRTWQGKQGQTMYTCAERAA